MPHQFKFKTRWQEDADGYTCIVKAVDARTNHILSTVKINIPVQTAVNFVAIHGAFYKKLIEGSAKAIAKEIAERTLQKNRA